MNIHDIQAQINDLKAKMANASGDEKAGMEARLKELQEQLQSAGSDIKDKISELEDNVKE